MSVINTQPLIGSSGNQGGAYNLERSLRFRKSAPAYLTRTPASSGSTTTWTVSFWYKYSETGVLFEAGDFGNRDDGVVLGSSGNLEFYIYNSTYTGRLKTTQLLRDPSAWYHITCVWDTTNATSTERMRMYINGVRVTAFDIATYPSLNATSGLNTSSFAHGIGAWANASYPAGGYMADFRFIDGQALNASSFGENDTITGVWKPKRYAGTYGTNGFYLPFTNSSPSTYAGYFGGTAHARAASIGPFTNSTFTVESWINFTGTVADQACWDLSNTVGGYACYIQLQSSTGNFVLSMQNVGNITVAYSGYLNKWTHVAVSYDGTTYRLFLDGVVKGTLTSATLINNVAVATVGGRSDSTQVSGYAWVGYVSNFRYVVGTCLYTANFTPSTSALTNITNTKVLTCQDSTFIDNSSNAYSMTTSGSPTTSVQYPFTINIAGDYSGNGNNWRTNNISLVAGSTYDSMTDVPTLTSATAANYAVMNPLDLGQTSTITEGNLRFASSSNANYSICRASIGVSSGKWYWEVTANNASTGNGVGIAKSTAALNNYLGSDASGYCYFGNGDKYNNGTGGAYGATYTTNDVIGVALDMDAGTLVFYKNNTSQGTAYSSISGTLFPSVTDGSGGAVSDLTSNFGQRPFAYTPPTGFKALNTYNLPDSTIKAGNKYIDATTYSGTGANATITNAGAFKPDFVWIKNRSSAENHALYDSVRGVNQRLVSNSTGADSTVAGVSAFNSGGFDINVNYSTSGQTYVGWQWQAGQGSTSSNTSGTITSTVSANPSAGFSVVTFSGNGSAATIGHGLGVAPRFIIVKNRTLTDDWCVYHADAGASNYSQLNLDSAFGSNSTIWNSTAPTSSVFSVGTYLSKSGSNYVAYCWSEIEGFSKFGKYTGNGSTDGPFAYLGFRPKYIMFKNISASGNWEVYDTSRSLFNTTDRYSIPNLNIAEGVAPNRFDYLSNGVKVRDTGGSINGNGNTIVYMAFAENPFKNSLAR